MSRHTHTHISLSLHLNINFEKFFKRFVLLHDDSENDKCRTCQCISTVLMLLDSMINHNDILKSIPTYLFSHN